LVIAGQRHLRARRIFGGTAVFAMVAHARRPVRPRKRPREPPRVSGAFHPGRRAAIPSRLSSAETVSVAAGRGEA
jgi:hypothetical protein